MREKHIARTTKLLYYSVMIRRVTDNEIKQVSEFILGQRKNNGLYSDFTIN